MPVATRNECREELETLVASFDEGFDTPVLQDARRVLTDLA
jgi:hypothetical protein